MPEALEHLIHDFGVRLGALRIGKGTGRQPFLSREQLIGLHGLTVRRGTLRATHPVRHRPAHVAFGRAGVLGK